MWPLLFYRRNTQHCYLTSAPLSGAAFLHDDWLPRVLLRLGELENSERLNDNPIRRLVLAKKAMRDVAASIERDTGVCCPNSCKDKLGTTMRFLRAVERHHWDYARRLSSAYPKLAELVNVNEWELLAYRSRAAARP